MSTFQIRAIAHWRKWLENPGGVRNPTVHYPTRNLNVTFNAKDIAEGRKVANEYLQEFHKTLPEVYERSLSGSSKPEVTNITFVEIHPLED